MIFQILFEIFLKNFFENWTFFGLFGLFGTAMVKFGLFIFWDLATLGATYITLFWNNRSFWSQRKNMVQQKGVVDKIRLDKKDETKKNFHTWR